MCVQVKVQEQLPGYWIVTHCPFLSGVAKVILFELLDDCFDRIDGGLLIDVGEFIVAVQVLAESVKAKMASSDAVRVEHWHYLYYECVQEGQSSRILICCLFTSQKVK